jgi:hypothetical protein
VVGLAWSNVPESYAGGCAAVRSFNVRQIKGDDPDTKGYPGPPGWGLSVRLTTPSRETYLVRNSNQSLGMGIKGRWKTLAKEFGFRSWNVRTMLRARSLK